MSGAAHEVDDLDELALLDDQELEEDDAESISLSDADSEGDEEEEEEAGLSEEDYNRLKFTVVDIVSAMGGIEEEGGDDGQIKNVYTLGDDCLRCLRDLRKLWRQDEDNPHRVIPRIYAEVNVLQTGLLPLLLKATSTGENGRKIALACTDLLATITWPIDYSIEKRAAELKEEVDGEAIATLHILERAMISYKSAILRTRSKETNGSKRSVLSSIMLLVLLPCLSKARHERTERDLGVINMCLHLFRNLLAINDPIATSISSSDEIAMSRLQSDLVVEMHSSRILDTILMLCSNADSKDFNAWNVVSCECVYYIYARSRPEDMMKVEEACTSSTTKPVKHVKPNGASSLGILLAAESQERRENQLRNGTTRHSRFNTMINFIDKDGNRRMATGQSALKKNVEQLTIEADAKGKRRFRRRKLLEEKGTTLSKAMWTSSALNIISTWADKFLRYGFESLTRSVLEDIRRERPKVGDLDQARTRVMQLGGFFVEYFLQKRQATNSIRQALNDISNADPLDAGVDGKQKEAQEEWSFSLIQQWLEPWALRMAYVRCASSSERRQWSEYIAAVNLWSTLFKLVDQLWKSDVEADREVAEGILANHFYDQVALDSAKAVFASYGSQSFACLRAIISLAHIMPRMLERYSKDKEHMYVKAKKQVRSSKTSEAVTTSLAEDEQEVQSIAKDEQHERKFEFEKFQSKMCSQKLADACLAYLARWKEFHNRPEEQLYNVVQVMYRLIVKAGDHRLFFPYNRRASIKAIQDDYLFWSFVKLRAPAVENDARKLFAYVLRKFDKLDDTEKARWAEGMGAQRPVKVFKMPAELEISPSRGHVDDIGIAVGLLLEKDMLRSLMWIKGGLEAALLEKREIIDEERVSAEADEEEGSIPKSALSRFADHEMLYDDDEIRTDASTKSEVKLLCRLLGLKSEETDSHRWVWIVPADTLPHELERDIETIEDFIRRPFEIFGTSYQDMIQKVRKRKSKATAMRTIINEHGEEEEVAMPKVKARRKEKASTWVDDDFIEDSDEEMEIVARILKEREEQKRIKAADVQDGQENMAARLSEGEEASSPEGEKSNSGASHISRSSPPSSSTSTPRPKQTKDTFRSSALFLQSDDEGEASEEDDESNQLLQTERERALAKRALVMSDDEEEDTSAQTILPQRKRRALIDDDEEDD